MDKDHGKHVSRQRMDQIGCVWLFISMFDFRHEGSTQKLLTDKKRGSKRITGNGIFGAKHGKPTCSCENSRRIFEGEDGALSVKTLIEEEMSGEKDEDDGKKGNRKKRNKSCSNRHDGIINVPTARDGDLVETDDRSLSSLSEFTTCTKNDDGEEKFSELIKRLIAQKEGKIQSCHDLLGEFQVSGSKEEGSLLNISDEPIPPLMGDAQSLGDSQRMEEEDPGTEITRKKKRKLFGWKVKYPDITSPDQDSTCQVPRTIVILKPGPDSSEVGIHSTVKKARNGGGPGPRFLINAIKRILKSSASKEPCDGGSEAVSDQRQNCCSEEQVHASRQDTSHTRKGSKKNTSGIYVAAKKHLSEMLATADIDVNLPSKEVPRILGRILSLPQFSSPAASPRRISVHVPLRQNTEKPKIQQCRVDEDPDEHEETISTVDAPIPGGDHLTECFLDYHYSGGVSETLVEAEAMDETQLTRLDPLSETRASSVLVPAVMDNDEDALEWQETDGDKNPLKQVDEGQSSSSTDVLGKLSPVSVLDPPFTDDDVCSRGSRSRSGEIRMQPLCIRFDEPDSPKADHDNEVETYMDDKESTLSYVKAVVKASGFDWEKLCIKSFHSDQLLEPGLMDGIDFCPNQLCHDKKLLFDCIDDTLIEFCGLEFGSGPWISFVKPTFRIMADTEDVVKAVEEEVYWHLLPLPFPHTLDQIVRKDMARTGNWMDLRFDIGCIGAGTGETILDELMEEIIRSYM